MASSGPLSIYAPPSVYTETFANADAANLATGLRLPTVIGVGQEELEQDNLDLVRGSSASIDQRIVNEDVSSHWVVDATNPQNPVLGTQNGLRSTFKVQNFPIVDGGGSGRTTNAVKDLVVTVNGSPVALGAVQGAKGLVTLQVPPAADDVVRCTYYFHRGDFSFTDTVSNQVTTTNASITTPGYATFVITLGQNDTFKLTVNGVDSTIVFPAATYTAAGLKTIIDAAAVTNLVTTVYTDETGKDHLTFTTTKDLAIGDGTANGPFGFTAGTATTRNRTFQVYNRPMVDGSGGGITTTDTSKVTVLVNSVQTIPASVDGKNGTVTLGFAPAPGSIVQVTYWANTWQDTFDYLPNSLVTSVLSCGISANRSDYIQGQDFVISNPTADVSIIHWGASFVAAAGQTSPGAVAFDDTQIRGSLVDDKYYLALCTAVTDTTVIPAVVSSTDFLLPEIPTLGNGRDTPLGTTSYLNVTNLRQDLISNRPDLVTVRAGRNLADAMNHTALVVTKVDGLNRKITLRDPLPPDYKVYATFWYNRIADDTYVLTSAVPGALGVGKYTVQSSLTGKSLYQVKLGTKSGLSQTLQWPRGVEQIPDAFHSGAGTPVAETVTVTLGTQAASNARFTNRLAEPYSFFTPDSGTWITKVNGTDRSTNLNTAVKGFLVGSHVASIQTVGPDTGKITIPASPANVLNLVIDGTAVAVTLTAGVRTAAQILTDINGAIDGNGAFSGTAPNALAAAAQIGGGGAGDWVFWIKSYTTPAALPDGFDHSSYVQIAQGTAEGVLGFRTLQRADGTSVSLNKPATLLGSLAGTYNITAGVNDSFAFRVDGTEYTVTLPSGASVATSAVVTAINTAVGSTVSSAGTLTNLNKLRLFSTTNGAASKVEILSSNAATTLGFTAGDVAYAGKVKVQDIVDALMSTSSFTTGAVAYPTTINGSQYLTVESITTGASGSSIAFVGGTNTAFNVGTGVGITAGTDGDVGEDSSNNFVVTSNNASGSAGSGVPGQTYTDARTGLRFSLLPASTGSYTATGYFTLLVGTTFDVSSSVPTYAMAGLETLVTNTVGVPVNDSASVQSFNPGGAEPAVGDVYYLSYRFQKQDFSTRIFQRVKTLEANYGPTSPSSPASLAGYIEIMNGATLVAVKQVLKVPNTAQASDQSFANALQELTIPLDGNVKPDIITPLTGSTAVAAQLLGHCEIQSGKIAQSERMGFIGFSSGTSPTNAQTIAKGLNSNRILATYPEAAVIQLQDEVGQVYESLIDGYFVAAAIAGTAVSPAIDVATPYTRRLIKVFNRLQRKMDPIEANQTAMAGITVVESAAPGLLRIRQGLTTKMDNLLTKLPTCTQIADFVQQQTRGSLDGFIGLKFLASRTTDVMVTMTNLLKSIRAAEIISGFTGVNATVSPQDETTLLFEALYAPIFPLEYILVRFSVRTRV